MRKYLLTLLITIVNLTAWGHYSLHSVSGEVKVESGGNQKPAQKGMALKASDYLVIPQGGKVEIYNDLDKKIYTSVATGKISVTRLMIDARGTASDNRGNVASRLRFGKKANAGNERLYVEKGMVKRSLGVYDPEGEKIVADPAVIARYIAAKLTDSGEFAGDSLPVETVKEIKNEEGISFKIRNTLEFPIYFNIVKISGNGNRRKVSISEIGQPAGVYVLLPRQTMSREHFQPVLSDESHILVMTHSQFDVDEMIEQMETIFRNGKDTGPSPEKNLPLYLSRF